MGQLAQDLRFTIRQLQKQPAFAITAVFVLALGIGASTATFSVLYQAVLRPLPYPDASQLLFIHNLFPKSQTSAAGVSGFDYSEIRKQTQLFSDAGVFYWNDLTLTGLGNARHLDVVNASASVFGVLNVKPQLGRIFSEAEDQHGAAGTAVLSDQLWRGEFGADRKVLGRVIRLNGLPYTVVGVMPRSFQFPSSETQLWLPVALRKGEFTLQGGRLEKWLHMVARLRPEVTLKEAQAGLLTVSDQMGRAVPPFYPRKDGWHFTARQLADEQTEAIRRWLYLAFGAVMSVLLIACVNVSGLLLIRSTARSGEIAVRRAIGATTRRIIWQMLTETGVLVFAGCALGLLLAAWAVHLVNLYGPMTQPAHIQIGTLLFSLALALISTIFVGLTPALLAAELSVEQTLRSSASRTSSRGSTLRFGIVAAQIALAVALIFVATQLNRSFLNLTRVSPGFGREHIWSGALTLSNNSYTAEQSWNTRFFSPLFKLFAASPGVQAASGGPVPFNPSGIWTEGFKLPERGKVTPTPEAQIGVAFPGYFETIGIPLLKGRTFDDRDRAGSTPVTIIDEELAHRYFQRQDPLGKLITVGGAQTPAQIIGVVGSVHNSDLGGPREPEVYFPELQERTLETYLVLRTSGNLDPTGAVRQAIARLDPTAALYDVRFMDDRVAASLKMRRFIAFLLNGLAAMALILSIVGLYGSLAHLVALRQREIGIRLALGAMQSQIMRMILARASIVVAAGLTVGTAISIVAGQAVRTQLFGVRLIDADTWAGILCLMLATSAISACLPAWRGARVEPSVALRSE